MALVLIAEDGSGLSNANSLTSVAFADSYYERVPASYVHAAKWALPASTNAVKSQVLVLATDLIKTRWQFRGTKKHVSQALPFPRVNIWDESSFYVDDSSVPESIQFGTAELAGYLLVSDRTAEAKTKGIKELTVDVIKMVFDKLDRSGVFPDSVQALLSVYGSQLGGVGGGPKLLTRY